MSPANKFWLAVSSIIILLLSISSSFFFNTFLITYIIVGAVTFFALIKELTELYADQDKYLEEKRKEESNRYFSIYKTDRSEEIAKKEFLIKTSYLYWIVFGIKTFNNYLNNKFSKNE